MEEVITEFKGEWEGLSNFAPCHIFAREFEFPTLENAFQALKCIKDSDAARFVSLSPGDAKRLGRRVDLRPDWERVKVSIMKSLLRQKFLSKPEYTCLLLSTGYARLEEGNTWGDRFWGVCLPKREGKNMLGRLLMEIREEIRIMQSGVWPEQKQEVASK